MSLRFAGLSGFASAFPAFAGAAPVPAAAVRPGHVGWPVAERHQPPRNEMLPHRPLPVQTLNRWRLRVEAVWRRGAADVAPADRRAPPKGPSLGRFFIGAQASPRASR